MFAMFRRTLNVERKSAGKYIDGLWQDGEVTKFTIQASVQGTNAFILQTLEEGVRNKGNYTLRTSSKLTMGQIGVSTPDVVIIDDERFIVVRVTPWQNIKATSHYKIVVAREGADAS